MKNVKIFVACGSGIATSTVIQEKVKKALNNNDIENYTVTTGTISQIDMMAKKVDLILTTTNIKKEYDTPVIQVINLLAGINEEEKNQEIVTAVKNILNNN